MYSQFSNCNLFEDEDECGFRSNILTVSSERKATIRDEAAKSNVTLEQIEELYDELDKIESNTDDLTDYSVAQIAYFIEKRIKTTKQFCCLLCRNIFELNEKVAENISIKPTQRACYSTFSICKQTERFMKAVLLTGKINFEVIYHEILQSIDFDTLFMETDFTNHFDHKIFLIRYIIDEFIRIKGTHIAKNATLNEHKNSLRVKFHKLTHFMGQ